MIQKLPIHGFVWGKVDDSTHEKMVTNLKDKERA